MNSHFPMVFPVFVQYLRRIFPDVCPISWQSAAPGRLGLGAGGGCHHRARPGVAFYG